MKTMLLLLCLLLGGKSAQAQNLVPNPSFEDYTECPSGYGPYEGMERAAEWYYMLGGPELYNVCDAGDTAGVPANCFGYQMPASGDGYMGMIAFSNCNCPTGLHEVIGVRLLEPLVVGETYWASVKVSWTTGYPNLDCFPGMASNRMGLLCRMDSVGQGFGTGGWGDFPNQAQISSQSIITDSVSWTTIAGSFVADSAYEWLYVGNFFGDDQTQFTVVNPLGDEVAYYYVDDVCISPDQTMCPTSVGWDPPPVEDVISVSWGADGGTVFMSGLAHGVHHDVSLYDLAGRLLDAGVVIASDGLAQWSVPSLDHRTGIFILQIRGGPGEWIKKLPASFH